MIIIMKSRRYTAVFEASLITLLVYDSLYNYILINFTCDYFILYYDSGNQYDWAII